MELVQSENLWFPQLQLGIQHVYKHLQGSERKVAWIGITTVLFIFMAVRAIKNNTPKRPPPGPNFPPIVHLSKQQIFQDPITSYANAMRDYGDIIAVKKKDKLEVVVSEKYVSKVLTDEANFSFEEGVADAMNFEFLMELTQGKIFRIMADVSEKLLSKRMDIIVQQVCHVFFSKANELARSPNLDNVDVFEHCQQTVSEAMVLLILGKKFMSPGNTKAVQLAANDVAELGGIFQNRSYFARTFPPLWRLVTWLKVVVLRFTFGLFLFLGWPIWKEMTSLLKDPKTYEVGDNVTLLQLLVRRFASPERTLSKSDRARIYFCLIAIMFASVHQVATTMVWVLCELALRPDYQDELYNEVHHYLSNGTESLTHDSLKRAVRTDSFIREVMRTKGDTFSTVRMARQDVQLGDYTIPKGYTVHPNAYMAHNAPEQAGEDPEIFDGRRWIDRKKSAAMTGTGHLAFGLGRWACPGRFFAVAEIKLMVFSILSNFHVKLVDDHFEIVDKLMIASAPPETSFILTKRG